MAGDGSQIYPDTHGIALYYLINIGTIAFRHGSGQAPIVNTYPTVSSETESPADDEIISGPVVNARRDVGELTRIADLALAESATAATVALTDGTLALWVQTAAIPEAEQDRVQRDYLQQLDRLREAHLPIGAFLSRPRSTNVTQLAYLATFDDPDKALSSVMNDRGPAFKGPARYDRVDDAAAARSTQRPVRSCPGLEHDVSRSRAQHPFLLRQCRHGAQPEIARIEVPVWIAQDRSAVGVLHAAIVEQCKVSPGYPYVLARAHEIAVVTNTERAEFEKMIATQLTRQGLEALPSEKAHQKTLLANRR